MSDPTSNGLNFIDFLVKYDGYMAFRKLSGAPRNQNTMRQYNKFLGLTERGKGEFTEEMKYKIEWLTGPNAEVMFRIWKAQNGPD